LACKNTTALVLSGDSGLARGRYFQYGEIKEVKFLFVPKLPSMGQGGKMLRLNSPDIMSHFDSSLR